MSETESTTDDDSASFDTRLWVTDDAREWVNSQKRGSETQADVINHLIHVHEALEGLIGDVPREPTSKEELRIALDIEPTHGGGVDVDALADGVVDQLGSGGVNTDAVADAVANQLGGNSVDVESLADAIVERNGVDYNALVESVAKDAVEDAEFTLDETKVANDLRDAFDVKTDYGADEKEVADEVVDQLLGKGLNAGAVAEQVAEELDVSDMNAEDVRAAAERGTENALENIR